METREYVIIDVSELHASAIKITLAWLLFAQQSLI